VIADGHHRYETALTYRDERRAAATATGAMLRTNGCSSTSPTRSRRESAAADHRLVLKGRCPPRSGCASACRWEIRSVPISDPRELTDLLARHLEPLGDRHAFAADDASVAADLCAAAQLRRAHRARDHREVIEGVFGLDEAAVRAGAIAYPSPRSRPARSARVARGRALSESALRRGCVPRDGRGRGAAQKSTFFTPKLPSGLVFRSLDVA